MLPKTGSRLRSRNQVPVSSRWYIRLSQESGGRSNPRSASLPTAWRESSARTGCARRAAHERWSTACAGAPIPPAGGDLRRPASRTTQRAAWRARARSMRSSPSPPSRRPIPTASAVASSRVATASASGSRTASSRSRRRAPRYPPSARKPIAMSVRAAPNTSIRNMRRSETWAALLTQRGRPVLASAPVHDAGYFEREYFQLHPGKVKYLDYLVRLLRRHGVPPGGRVLDVGAGYGFFLAALEKAGYEADGLELSEHAAAEARQRVRGQVLVQ